MDWIEAAFNRAIEPLINGAAALVVAVFVGTALNLLFRWFGQRILDAVLIPFFKTCDSVLIRRIAPLTGVGLVKPGLRWTAFGSWLFGLVFVATFAPVAVALLAVLFGVIVVLAVYRAWESDELDRKIREDNGQNPLQQNDLGNEILVGLVFLIVFFTLGFARLSEQETIYRGQPVVPVATTAAFIWGEILKAIPLVDASEVYGLRNISGLEAHGFMGRTLTFSFRVLLDFILIATIVRGLEIVRRRLSGQDLRDIRRAYSSSDSDAIFKALVRLSDFALSGKLAPQTELERIALQDVNVAKLRNPAVLVLVGQMLMNVASKFGGTRHILPAVEAFRSALNKYTRDATPVEWALTNDELGKALASFGWIAGKSSEIEKAVAAHQAALEVRTQEAMPLDWAATQENLGGALHSLGRLEHDVKKLRAAANAHRAALEVYTQSTTPNEWALTQRNLGAALISLGQICKDVDQFKHAIDAFQAAMEVFTLENFAVEWAQTMNHLGSARTALGQHTRDTGHLKAAVDAYHASLEVFRREKAPRDWAGTKNNLGMALMFLGIMDKNTGHLQESIAAFRSSLEVRTKEAMPYEWASTEGLLGRALASYAKISGDSAYLTEAISALERVAAYYVHSGDARGLAKTSSMIQKFEEN